MPSPTGSGTTPRDESSSPTGTTGRVATVRARAAIINAEANIATRILEDIPAELKSAMEGDAKVQLSDLPLLLPEAHLSARLSRRRDGQHDSGRHRSRLVQPRAGTGAAQHPLLLQQDVARRRRGGAQQRRDGEDELPGLERARPALPRHHREGRSRARVPAKQELLHALSGLHHRGLPEAREALRQHLLRQRGVPEPGHPLPRGGRSGDPGGPAGERSSSSHSASSRTNSA